MGVAEVASNKRRGRGPRSALESSLYAPAMAARRLVLILLLLLIVSTFAATLVPPPESDDEESTTTSPATTRATGELVHQTISADAKQPQRVRLRLGDELRLRVSSPQFHEVEIPRLDLVDEVDPFAPAVFDLLPDERGVYPVRVVESGRVIGRIDVSGCCRTSGRSGDTSRSR